MEVITTFAKVFGERLGFFLVLFGFLKTWGYVFFFLKKTATSTKLNKLARLPGGLVGLFNSLGGPWLQAHNWSYYSSRIFPEQCGLWN